tara:strand:- start:16200 stop:16514 length:315 start_codon:yes stop_codon:yes gene_type:complete
MKFYSKLPEPDDMTKEKSLKIIEKYIAKDNFLGFRNHSKYSNEKNTFRFTLMALNFEFIQSLEKDPMVKKVYWHPSAPPPGGGMDGISMRYRVYVKYHSKGKDK